MMTLQGRFARVSANPLLREVATVVLLFTAWRAMLFGLVFLGGAMTRERPDRDADTFAWQAFPGSYFWDGWARWDSGWYMTIVEHGYRIQRGGQSNVAFFPLYPYATAAVAKVVGNPWAAGLIVSNASVLMSLFFLRRIALHSLDPDGAKRSLVYLLSFPTSFFLSSFYTEGMFLLVTAASFYHYLRGDFFRCGAWGFLACMTRHAGLALFVAFAVGQAWNVGSRASRFRASSLWLLLIPCGTLGVMLIMYVQVGDPLAFLKAHAAWGRSFLLPHRTLAGALARTDWSFPRDMMNTITFMDAVSVVPFLILPLLMFRKFDVSLPIYSLLMVLIPLASGSVKSMMRVEAVAFPAFLALARLGANRDVDRAIVFVSGLFLGLLTIQFANWYWVG